MTGTGPNKSDRTGPAGRPVFCRSTGGPAGNRSTGPDRPVAGTGSISDWCHNDGDCEPCRHRISRMCIGEHMSFDVKKNPFYFL